MTSKSSIVVDREQEKSLDPSSDTMSAMRFVATQGRPLDLLLRPRVEHVRYGRSVPRLSSPVDLDPVSFVQSLVAAFGLVCAVSEGKLQSFPALRDKSEQLRYCE